MEHLILKVQIPEDKVLEMNGRVYPANDRPNFFLEMDKIYKNGYHLVSTIYVVQWGYALLFFEHV